MNIVDTNKVSRPEREQELLQKARVIWMTGLSGSGKTTNAYLLERKLFSAGFLCRVVDGDDVRQGLNSDLSFSIEHRAENIRRVAQVAKLLADTGVITICSFISPTNEIRRMAREIIGDDFVEVFVDAPLAVCEARDVKGFYQKARRGAIPDFTGISSPFDVPTDPAITISTVSLTPEQTSQQLFEAIYPLVSCKNG